MLKKSILTMAITATMITPVSAIAEPFSNGIATFVGIQDTPITGDIDRSANTMTVDPWFFFGFLTYTSDIELYGPGSYSTAGGDFDVPAGHVGASMMFNWNGNEIDGVMVWQVTPAGTHDEYRIIDSDGDGILGHALTNGPFPGQTVYYQFDAPPTGEPGPGIYVALNVEGGNLQECTGNSSATVSIDALPTLIGGTVLDDVYWTVDGTSAGSGLGITETLTLGGHTISATAVTTTGESDDASTQIVVQDTERPEVAIDFVSNNGNGEPINVDTELAEPGRYEISLKVTDSCDPAPVITYSDAQEIMNITDGDVIAVTNNTDNLKLPKTGVRVQASGRDASGNASFSESKTLRFR